MAIYESQEKMYTILGGLFEELLKDEAILKKLAASDVSTCYEVKDPEGKIWIMPDGSVLYGDQDFKPTVTMLLGGDTCHKFWMRQISMPLALAKGLIKAKGPMNKVLKLLPLLGPAFAGYPDFAKKHGIEG